MAVLRVFSDDKLIEQLDITTERVTIGRIAGNDLVLPGKGVSKHHAVIEKHGPNYLLIDAGSSNGTFVGSNRVERRQLEYWDEIHIAGFVIKFLGTQRHREQEGATADDELLNSVADQTTVLSADAIANLIGARPKPVKPVLLPVASGPTLAARFEMDKPEALIGKASNCDIQLGGFWAAKKAARLCWEGDKVFLERLTFHSVQVNRRKVRDRVQLRNGDRLIVSGIEMEFRHVPSRE